MDAPLRPFLCAIVEARQRHDRLYHPRGEAEWSGFTGERWEAYSALLFLRARYYEPGTGRFISKDPGVGSLQSPGTLNPYAYVENRVTTRLDPSGLRSIAQSFTAGNYGFEVPECGPGCWFLVSRHKFYSSLYYTPLEWEFPPPNLPRGTVLRYHGDLAKNPARAGGHPRVLWTVAMDPDYLKYYGSLKRGDRLCILELTSRMPCHGNSRFEDTGNIGSGEEAKYWLDIYAGEGKQSLSTYKFASTGKQRYKFTVLRAGKPGEICPCGMPQPY